MKGLLLKAEWQPRAGYKVSRFEAQSKIAITGSSVWKNPILEITDVKKPVIGADDVLVRVKACGVCGSDVHFYETDKEGYIKYPGLTRFPAILGHEFSGVVEEVGKHVSSLVEGDMVTAEEMIWCGHCTPCRNGFPNQCANLEEIGFTINGAFAEYIAIGAKYCWKLDALRARCGDNDKTYEAGATVEPTAVAYNGIFVRAGGFKPGAYVVVYGAGPIGLAAIALCKAAGAAKVVALEVSAARRTLAKKMGADFIFDPAALKNENTSVHERILELTDGEGADVHVEAAGVPLKTIPEMEKSLAIGGKIVQIGRAAERVPLYIETLQVRRGQLYGSQGHSGDGIFPNVIRLMAAGAIDMTAMITARFPLDKALDAIATSVSRTDGKIMVTI